MIGKSIKLSLSRRLTCDFLSAARAAPTVPVRRHMRLAEVVGARAASFQRPSWQAIFIKGYARVAAQIPELRRAYVKFPWPHLYEYPISVASVVVERDFNGENALFMGNVRNPAALPLGEIHRIIRGLQEDPIEECKDFQRSIRLGRLPWPIRQLLWWFGLNIGRHRGNYFGTFAVSVYSALGAESLHPLTPATTTLHYGVIAPGGGVDVGLVYDHRVLDGTTVARALALLESELLGSVCAELRASAAGLSRAA
jgi:hypothetical protein